MLIDRLLCRTSSLGLDSKGKRDEEDSTLLKIAACIPVLGLMISQIQSHSLQKKLHKLPLPKEFRPYPIKGKILHENATSTEKKAACQRAAQLESINNDYTKTALINNILTIALVVYGLAINVIPFIIGAPLIGVYCLTAFTFAVVLHINRSDDIYRRNK